MRAFFPIALLTVFCLGCANGPDPSQPPEVLVLDTDLDDWELASQTRVPGMAFQRELIPNGEDKDQWSRQITVEFLDEREVDAETFVRELAEMREKQCPEREFELIDLEEDSAYYRFSFIECSDWESYSEISRLVQGELGVHRISYAVRDRALNQDEIRHWMKVFRNARLAPREDTTTPQ